MTEPIQLFKIRPSVFAEDAGYGWTWREPCPQCRRTGPTQAGSVTVTLVSDAATVLGTDSGLLLVSDSVLAAANRAGIAFSVRAADVKDGTRMTPWWQITGDTSVRVQSVDREPCGCVRRVHWRPLVVQSPTEPAHAFSLDVLDGPVLVDPGLCRVLVVADPALAVTPVDVI